MQTFLALGQPPGKFDETQQVDGLVKLGEARGNLLSSLTWVWIKNTSQRCPPIDILSAFVLPFYLAYLWTYPDILSSTRSDILADTSLGIFSDIPSEILV